MATKNLAVESVTTPTVLTGDQVIAEVQEILQSDGFGLFQMFARPSQRNGSLFTYKTPERLIPEAYDRTTNGALGKGGKVSQVDILASNEDVVYFEIEDMAFNTQVEAAAEKARLANSMVQSMMAQLDAEILSTMITDASGTAAVTGLSPAADQDALATARLHLGDAVAENESLIDAKTLGVSAKRQLTILTPKAYWRYINSFDTNVLEQSNEIKVGNLTIREVNGSIIVKHPALGKTFAAGELHKTKTYDLAATAAGKKVEGILVTDIAAAFPMTVNKFTTRINRFGNEEIIGKYKFGKGLIRPALVKVLIEAA